jgi:quercetin dioxygenase-like cupin family protein
MERRKFIQNTLGMMAAASAAIPVMAATYTPPKKGFKVKALENRYKEKIVLGDIPIDFKLLSSDTENRLSVFISSNNKKGYGPPLHIHHTFDEIFCVLQGSFLFQLDNEQFSLEAGDTIFIPRNVKHAFTYSGETSGTLLVGITPGKGMEEYFAGMAPLLNGQGMPDMQAMQALYKRYDSQIVGPPMQ